MSIPLHFIFPCHACGLAQRVPLDEHGFWSGTCQCGEVLSVQVMEDEWDRQRALFAELGVVWPYPERRVH